MVRVKHRYLLVEIVPAGNPRRQIPRMEVLLYQAVKHVVLETHGDLGLASIHKYLQVKYVNRYTNIAIIRTKRGSQRLLSSALACMKQLGDVEVTLNVLHVAGTVRNVHKFLVRHHHRQLPLLLRECSGAEDRAGLLAAVATCGDVSLTRTKRRAATAQHSDSDDDANLDVFDR